MRSICKSITLIAAIVCCLPGSSGGQIMRRPAAKKPVNWVGANIGIVQGYTLLDGTTQATWRFGSGIEYAARWEHPTQNGIAVGLQGSYANMPLSYSSSTGGCGTCEARATVMQMMGLAHYGSGYSFHGVYELTAGAIGFSNFREQSTNQQLTGNATGTDYDFKFALGYGLGFGLSPSSAIEVVQELGWVLHQKTGLPASTSNYPRVSVTRLGGKLSF